MACRPSKAAAAGLAQATALWPNRNKASDGTCASQAHSQQNPSSDHEPNENGEALAFDLTDDPAHGVDTWALWDGIRLRKDPRVKYGICDDRMFSSYSTSGYPAWTWRPYSGSNPHTTHAHTSILEGHENDTSPWFDKQGDPLMAVKDEIIDSVQNQGKLGREVTQAQTTEIDRKLEKMEAKFNRKLDELLAKVSALG